MTAEAKNYSSELGLTVLGGALVLGISKLTRGNVMWLQILEGTKCDEKAQTPFWLLVFSVKRK